ncbi:hypothetical protein SAMN06265349_101948 [Flavobacterium resistens]|uniref:Lipocalin-like domain-containing protein n=1 Tax=Flavobacterium resistens TaxID=443612 RepID=A0A521BCR5_9FLAO|nr:hypothetical protein [Flavobacterium resistens]MRX67266.1 hypothetical protein [Flavobacterium resistens]SMO44873.1 hypothetical protein SAMN06265349_101948 [Flavobacterium resistens]
MKMKVTILLIVSLLFLECSKLQIQKDKILGTWIMVNASNSPDENVTDKTTYFKNGSIISEIYITDRRKKNKQKGTIRMSYKLDTIENTLEIILDKKIKKKFQIEKLTDNKLELKDLENGRILESTRVKR